MFPLPLSFILLSCWSLVNAGSANNGEPCKTGDNRLQIGTYQFFGTCNSVTYCAEDTQTCTLKTCRKDDFPFGYVKGGPKVPPKCGDDEFCPDEGSGCQAKFDPGVKCQFNRDDQCKPPPNAAELADTSGRGLNWNGAVCLNNFCMWANKSSGEDCTVENTAYIAYKNESEFIDIVSRGDCRLGLYCDSPTKKCIQEKAIGEACSADKECASWNCLSGGTCGQDVSIPRHVATWVYVVVAAGIFGGIFGTLFGLFIFHRKQRDQERERRVQYWREQNAFHQSLLQMRQTARASILSLPGNGNSGHNSMYADEQPILQHAAPKGSGLRHYVGDDSSEYDEGMMQHTKQHDNRF
ncbi:hypothetical protein C8J57DRAFT_1117621 [Mycena rebaudengoi]|nr:hypothetical protein C8J57DRAFT_1117621 [Mycena rebaudengoi]